MSHSPAVPLKLVEFQDVQLVEFGVGTSLDQSSNMSGIVAMAVAKYCSVRTLSLSLHGIDCLLRDADSLPFVIQCFDSPVG